MVNTTVVPHSVHLVSMAHSNEDFMLKQHFQALSRGYASLLSPSRQSLRLHFGFAGLSLQVLPSLPASLTSNDRVCLLRLQPCQHPSPTLPQPPVLPHFPPLVVAGLDRVGGRCQGRQG